VICKKTPTDIVNRKSFHIDGVTVLSINIKSENPLKIVILSGFLPDLGLLTMLKKESKYLVRKSIIYKVKIVIKLLISNRLRQNDRQ
jgi:hypothetical protein